MTKDIRLTFPAMFQETVKNFGERNALAFVGEKALNFKEANTRVLNLIAFFEQLGLKSDDKVAILSANMPNWGIAYFATTFMQAVAIPILPDFSANEIENILNHSEAKVVLVSGKLQGKVAGVNCPGLKHILNIEDFSIISSTDKTSSFNESSFPQHNYNVEEDDLATIIYTSGTTGKSKGVMLSHKNITANAIAAGKVQPVDEDDRFLSILPLSHVYENTLGLILPMIYGASVYYLHEKPVPSVLLPALKTVKPTLILSVPLIIEKFLIEAKFPYAIGYGLTESAPIIAGLNPQHQRLQSTGPAVEGVELRLDEKDPVTGVGEILAKGPNIMMGYYKEPEETKKVITEDGWLRTGDLGAFDEENYLFIKGRSKNVIIGANGENIYPEEIESVINNFRHVLESVVLERKGKLVALVHFNVEELEKNLHELHDEVSNYIEQRLKELEDELLQYVNLRVNKFSHLKLVVVHENPFQKTPTLKIKRFLYQ
jgi:long-chain acyl-CoA synthetase